MMGISSVIRGQWLAVSALIALGTTAVLCGSQLVTALVLRQVFAGAAGHAIWIVWPNAPELFIRAVLFYGLGFLVSFACAGVIGAGLLEDFCRRKE
jgi:hypothetical protein